MTNATPAHLDLRTLKHAHHWYGELVQFTHPLPRTVLWRWLHHKRWLYASITHPDYALAMAVVDTGYTGKGFVYLADRAKGNFILNISLLIPKGLGFGVVQQNQGSILAHAHSGQKLHLLLQRQPDGHTSLQAWGPDWQIDAQLQVTSIQQPLVAATHLAGGGTNLTQKSVGQPARARIVTPHKTLELDANTWGGIDFTDGLMPRHTRWYWAYATGQSATGELISFNIVEGFNGPCECSVWVNEQAIPLGEGRFQVTPNHPEQEWHIETTCGTVKLWFAPWVVERDQGDKGLVRYYFVQAFGHFKGEIKQADGTVVQFSGLTGFTEDQDVWW